MSKSKDVTAWVRQKLLPYFEHKLPPAFGRSAKRMVEERLRVDGEVSEGVVDTILLRGCDFMIDYLESGGTVQYPESLFHSFGCQALEDFREERARQDTFEIMRLLAGEGALVDSPLCDDKKVLIIVRKAIALLPERFASFVHLDFMEQLSEEEICEALDLRDHEEYLQLKRLSLAALRRAIERLLHRS
jgi:hypothetical protein